MLVRGVFIALVACSGPHQPPPPGPLPPQSDAQVYVTADAQVAPTLGAACGTCDPGQRCAPLPGGYCTSPCGVAGAACAGACVETPRAGELCMASCAADADCRAAEGYACDRTWHACMIPNTAAIVPRTCGPLPGFGRDPAFAPATALSTAATPGIYQFEPTAVTTDDGGLVALYISRGRIFEPNALGLGLVDAYDRATPDHAFATTKPSSFDPWLARAGGKLYAVWLQLPPNEVAFATSADRGATWSAPVAVEDPADCANADPDCLDKPMVITGPDPKNPKATIVYVAYAADGLRIRASRDGGATFGPPKTPLPGIYGNLATGADGLLYVVTLDGGPGGGYGSADQRIQLAASADGGATFTRPQTISRFGERIPFFFANPSIAVDDRRKWIYVAYARGGRDALWDIVVAASKDKGKTWQRTRIGDDPACAIHMVPNLAVDPTTGTLHVAWYDSHGPRFAHATCTPGAALCRQLGRINDTPFAALSTERHGAKWIGEYESLVVDDAHRWLHATWAQPVDEGGRIVTRIFHARAKLPAK